MAPTPTRSKPSANGAGAAVSDKARHATEAVHTAARQARGPALAAAAGVVGGLAGGLALGARAGSKRRGLRTLVSPRPRVLGVPIGPRGGALTTAKALRDGAKHLSSATDRVVSTSADVRKLREELERLNRRSPLEVVLDGLTHRRGAHRHER
jgi:hypothetical protein